MDVTEDLWSELWVSLGSLLRSYTAAYGLNSNSHAVIEVTEKQILASRGEKCLRLERTSAEVRWKREDGTGGILRMTPAGRLRGKDCEEEFDMAAEAWARDLMLASPGELRP